MNERLVTALGLFVALMLIVGLFAQPEEPSTVSRPTSEDLGRNGLTGLARWLEQERVLTESLRTRYTDLSHDPAGSSVLISLAPYERPMRLDERIHLLEWVEAGNTLVLLAALDDTPDWSFNTVGSGFMDGLSELTDTTFEGALDEADEPLTVGDFLEEGRVIFEPGSEAHPLLAGVGELVAYTDSTASIWRATEEGAGPGTPLFIERGSGMPAGWTRARGDGHLLLFAAGSLFSNRSLGEGDNARLLANVLRWHLSGTGKVIFDDLHQGLSALYDPAAFYSDRRVGASVLFLLGFWFLYMIGTQNRMLPYRSEVAAPSQADFVRAMGGFFARKLTPLDAGRLAIERFQHRLARRGVLGGVDDGLSGLDGHPLLAAEDVDTLRAHERSLRSGRPVDLKNLHNCLRRIDEALG